jgi:hypothetical protein
MVDYGFSAWNALSCSGVNPVTVVTSILADVPRDGFDQKARKQTCGPIVT